MNNQDKLDTQPTVWPHDALAENGAEHHIVRMRKLYAFTWYLYHELAISESAAPRVLSACVLASSHPVMERMRRDRGYNVIDPLSVLAKKNNDFVIEEEQYHRLLGVLYSVAHLRRKDMSAPYAKLLFAKRGYDKEKYVSIFNKPPPLAVTNAEVLVDVYLQVIELLYELSIILQKPIFLSAVDHNCPKSVREFDRYVFVRDSLDDISHHKEVESAHMVINMFKGMSPTKPLTVDSNYRTEAFDSYNQKKNGGLFENANPLFAYNNDPYVYQAFIGYAASKIMVKNALPTAYKILGELVVCALMYAD
jgi:hypothetical protein